MPQLLRAFGIKSFFTTKLSWSTVNRFPHTSFVWRGYDGSEVAAHVILLHDYNEAVNIKRLREDALHHQQAAVHPEFLVPTGYGDGGGGATEEMCERAARLKNLAGAPRTSWGSIEDFFERLNEASAELPVVSGELALELHRGVFTTHGRLKSAFRGLERALQIQEAAHVARGLGAIDAAVWRRLIVAQFHDYVPGSSIWEVYAEGIPELERLSAQAIDSAAKALGDSGEGGWFNPLPFSRRWIHDGNLYQLPPLSGAPSGELGVLPAVAPEATDTRLASDRVVAQFDESGGIASLVIDGEPVALVNGGHGLCAFPDRPAMFEAWEIDRHALVAGTAAKVEGKPASRIQGLVATLSFAYALGRSRVVANYSVTAGEPVLRIDYAIDWQEPEMLLKAIFRTRYLGRDVRFGAPFGSVLRSQLPGYAREEAAWEVPASRWMVVMDDAQHDGLGIVTEAKYGFSVRDGVVGVSLLRSALITEADLHPEIRDTPNRPRHSDIGRQHVRLALGRHSATRPVEEHPAALADALFTPCVGYGGAARSSGLREIVGAPSLVPAWAEPVDANTWILRLHEVDGRSGNARVLLHAGWRARRAAEDHSANTEAEADWTGGEFAVGFGPYQIVSMLISRRISSVP
jgi:alpha-mannosidase